MLPLAQANAFKINPQVLHTLENPLFAQQKPLWDKNKVNIPPNFFKNVKKYEFTKVGKTFGFQTTRFLALSQKTLYYFEQQESAQPLGSCEIQNIYAEWTKLEENRFVLVLNNGFEPTVYFFESEEFILDNRQELAKFTVQLGFFQKFNIIEQLGEGSYASVYKATDKKTNEPFSAKVFTRGTSLASILRQVDVLRQLIGKPNVCQYSALFQTDQEIIIVTRFIPGKDLKTVIHYSNGLEENDVKKIISGICNGLYQCHKQSIIHRDIKPQNVIINLDTMEPTIIDFGLSLDLKRSFCLNRCGTNAYMAPEVFNFPQTNQSYTNKCDIFSLGIVAHLLMLGNNPLKAEKEDKVAYKKFDLKRNLLQATGSWGQEGHQFLQKTLSFCTKSRWDITQVLLSQFLGQQAENGLKKIESCSTIEDKHIDYDIQV